MLIREARRAGTTRIVVTHGMIPPVSMSIEQMREAAGLGAYIEFVYNALIGATKAFELREYASAIRAVGPEHCILSSDLGQAGNPLHPDGLEAFFAGLRSQGFTVSEIERMAKANPARLLGLP
jgi:microsomal dipeptidase-like Zn-dependent dipeptidase